MSEAGTTARTSDDAERRRTTNPITFVGQIVDELRKVVRPTRSELLNYVLVVIVFVEFTDILAIPIASLVAPAAVIGAALI